MRVNVVFTCDLEWVISIFISQSEFSRSVVSDSVTPWTAARKASPSFTVSQSLLKLMSIESVMPSNHFILCDHLLFLPSSFPSIRVFSSELALCIWWSKFWNFSSNMSECSGLISFKIDWFDLPACPRDSQDFSLASQFESINSLELSLLCGPTLTPTND